MKWFQLAQFNRWYRQFSLARFLLALTAIAGVLAVVTAYYQSSAQAYRAEQQIVRAIQQRNGKVTLEWQGPSWISPLFGNSEVFNRVTHIHCDYHTDVPGVLDCLVDLKGIQNLSVLRIHLYEPDVINPLQSAANFDSMSINYVNFYLRRRRTDAKFVNLSGMMDGIKEDIAELRKDFPNLTLTWYLSS